MFDNKSRMAIYHNDEWKTTQEPEQEKEPKLYEANMGAQLQEDQMKTVCWSGWAYPSK